MADSPTEKLTSASESGSRGLWRKPEGASPAPTEAPRSGGVTGGWRVPALPQNISATPAEAGVWHLPKPEDTSFSPEDETEISEERQRVLEERPEDFLATFTLTPNQEAPTPVRPEDAVLGDGEVAPAKSASLLDLELGDLVAATGADADDDDQDTESGFSMSELIALSSLVEKKREPSIKPRPLPPLESEPASTEGATGAQVADAATESLSRTGGLAGEEDPAAVAARMAAMYGDPNAAPASSAAPAHDATAIAAEQAALYASPAQPAAPASGLAGRFQQTEAQVRALRAQYRAGQFTREQFQAELKKLMVLDDSNVWWMMGVETDNWYRFDNNQWVPAVPPYSSSGGQPLVGALPSLESVALGGPPPSSTYGLTEEYPLPRTGIPTTDPDLTMVGGGAVNFGQAQPYNTGFAPYSEQATVANPTVSGIDPLGYDATFQPATPGPIPATDPLAGGQAFGTDEPSERYAEAEQEARRRAMRTIITLGALAAGLLILCGALAIGAIVVQYNSYAAPYETAIAGLANYRPAFQTVRMLDSAGQTIAELNAEQGGARTNIPLEDVSPFMIHAVVSLENERFFEDPGWDAVAIARAFIQNVASGQVESGASTITQQIAEQLILGQATTTADLKLREIVIASQIAQRYSKQQILELYLNEISFGNQSYGVEAAARFYFDVSARDLNLAQSAMLAGMIANPNIYNPVRLTSDTPELYGQRRDNTFTRMEQVIARMQQVDCLTFQTGTQPFCVTTEVVRQARLDVARVKSREYRPRDVQFRHPHFVFWVRDQVEALYPGGEMYRRGFVIRTTLNPAVQTAAEGGLTQTMQTLINTGVNTGSVMVTDPRNGAILAMVGSPNFNDTSIAGQVNTALTPQQPGSSIKPILYAAALDGVDTTGDNRPDRWLTPASILWDVPTDFGNNYRPVNFDGRFRGPVALRFALQNSYNIPALKAYQFIGEAKFRDMATRLGIQFPPNAVFSLATGLGATEVTLYGMMEAYGTLANTGARVPLFSISGIVDSDNLPVDLPARPQPTPVIGAPVAFLMQNILSDDAARASAFGVNGPLTIQGLPTSGYVAAKTGTTDGARDLWTMGFTRNAVVGVWLGRPDDGQTQVRDGGYGSAAPLWNRVMVAALTAQGAPQGFPNPQGLLQQQICSDTGTLPPANCTAVRTELFIQGQDPPSADAAFVRSVQIDTWSGLIANEFCPDNRIQVTVLNIDDAAAVNWLQTTTEGRAVAQRLGITNDTLPQTPTAACSVNTEVPVARILSPTDGQTISGVFSIVGSAPGVASFNRFQLEYAPTSNPTAFTLFAGPITTPQNSGVLGQLNSLQLPNGDYVIRLAMFSQSGGYLYKTATVRVQNILPTPTIPLVIPTTAPLLLPTPTPLFGSQGAATPLPFEPVVTPAS